MISMGEVCYMGNDYTVVQRAALSLIQSDLRFLYTVIKEINPNESNYIPYDISFLAIEEM